MHPQAPCPTCQQNQVNQARRALHLQVPFLNQTVGLGDVIHGITQAAGVPQCEECKERQARLNQALQFRPWNT